GVGGYGSLSPAVYFFKTIRRSLQASQKGLVRSLGTGVGLSRPGIVDIVLLSCGILHPAPHRSRHHVARIMCRVLLLVKDISSSLTAGATVSAQGLKALGVTVSAQGLKALPHPPRDPPTERCPAFPSPQCAGRRTRSPAGGAWCAGQLGGRGGRVQVSERIRPA